MAELPSGTVSMLFSDIEGSTLLLGRLGARFLDVLEEHRRVMREAWAAHGGTEMGTEGDSFFVVFPTAVAAVAAAVQAQQGLQGEAWMAEERLRVRIGVHTGSPQVHERDYWGMDVHRAARIGASAHGGQVVVSAVTAELTGSQLPEGVTLRDLGFHHLKDLPDAEHLFQLEIPGLPQDFPALRSLGTSSSLPHPATTLVGRDREVDELATLLTGPDVRLLSLTGPGGAGKTRLAIALAGRVAAEFPDGVFFVPLAAATTAEVMWASVAETLDVPPRERAPDDLLASLARRRLLLVLDNLEQVHAADEVVARLLDAAYRVAVVVTSRRALNLPAERRVPVAPLTLPDDASLAAAERSGAVQLFVQRARNVKPGFALTEQNVRAVVGICRRLDGLPLAIELCAARSRLLSPAALLARLDGVLDIAATSSLATPRQRSLRETIAWSYELLSPAQQTFFRSLGAFAGGGDLAAVAAVSTPRPAPGGPATDALDAVAELVDASLADVGEGPDGEPRVVLLETLRVFADDQLRAAGESAEVQARHAAYYLGLAERLGALRGTRQMVARGLAEADLDNFREALAWALPGDPATAVRICAALGWFWWMGGYVAEGRRWHERVIAAADDEVSPELAACLGGLANLVLAQGEPEEARATARRSLAMARSVDDGAVEAFALSVIGTAEQQLGELESARDTLRESLAVHRRRDDKNGLARVLGNLAGLEEGLGNPAGAEELIREALEIHDRIGDVHQATIQRQNLANLLAVSGRPEEAAELARGLVDTVLQLDNPHLTMAFANTCMNILIRCGDPAGAARMFGAEEEMHERLEIPNPFQDEELAEALDLVAGTMTPGEWDEQRTLGRQRRVEDLLVELRSG